MLKPSNLVGLLITGGFFGAAMLSALPSLLSAAVEETFPTPPEISTRHGHGNLGRGHRPPRTLLFNSAILLQVFFTPLAQYVLNQAMALLP